MNEQEFCDSMAKSLRSQAESLRVQATAIEETAECYEWRLAELLKSPAAACGES